MVISFIAIATLQLPAGAARPSLLLCLAATLAVAAVGLVDDIMSLGIVPRLAVHVCAGIALAMLAMKGTATIWLIGPAVVGVTIGTVALINIVNFMDGVDGLVVVQGTVFATSVALLAPVGTFANASSVTLAGVCLGFAVWNWPPATVFLGDVGSGSLGFIATLEFVLAIRAGCSPIRVALPALPLLMDATTTLAVRVVKKENVTTAHRSHLYQRLVRSGWSHRSVTILYAAAALAGLLVVQQVPENRVPISAVVYSCAIATVGAILAHTAAKRPAPQPR